MERQIVIHQPRHVEIGAGSAARIADWAADFRKILILTSKSVAQQVPKLELNGSFELYEKIAAEPEEHVLLAALEVAKHYQPDAIIGLGGGSVMDIAKLVCVMWAGHQQLEDIVGSNRVLQRFSKLALIPTTAGTGSEAGIRALVTNSETKAKMAVESPLMCADLAILDPELTLSVPPALTAVTGIDAMAHCVEAFTNIRAHSVIDGYARMGFGAVGTYLSRAVKDGADKDARAGMMLASYYGGICLGPVNTAAGHALAYPLGTKLKLPHGLANALIFPHVLGFNQPVCPGKTDEVLIALGKSGATDSQTAFEQAYQFCHSLGIDMKLSSYGAQKEQLRSFAEEANGIRRLMDNNPRDMSIEDIEQIYQAAF
jgi:alcohol dehydrogenase class IV